MELLTISEENGSRIFENTEVVQLKYEDDEVKAITKIWLCGYRENSYSSNRI